MGSSSKKRQTFAKMTRERAVKERRALKQEKKDEKKRAAAAAKEADSTLPANLVDAETTPVPEGQNDPASLAEISRER